MKKLLNWNNFVGVSECANGAYDLEFHVQGLRMFIRNAEMYDRPAVGGISQHLYMKQNVERAIEQATEVDITEEVAEVTVSSDLLEEIADITADLANSSTDLVERLDKFAFTLQNQGKTAYKGATSVSEPKDEVALTAKQLADLGSALLTSKRMLEFQNHALYLENTPKEVNEENISAHYSELCRLTSTMLEANQGIVDVLETAGWLLLESTNKDEIEAYYNK